MAISSPHPIVPKCIWQKLSDAKNANNCYTHLRGHPADSGNIISRVDEVGRVLLQLELTQPLIDGLTVLTTERGNIYKASLSLSLSHTIHTLTPPITALTLPSRNCSGLTKPF